MWRIFIVAFLAFAFTLSASIDKLSFYKAFESNSTEKISEKINHLEKLNESTTKKAYIGALTMKKSQFEKTPKEKTTVFKVGRDLLEDAISLEPKNGEFRFLRLAIQENSPKILKYNTNVEEDVEIVISAYKSMDITLKKVVKTYAEQSVNLPISKLK